MNFQPLMQTLLAMLMAVPLHLCCWTGRMQAAEAEEACTGCHQFLEPSELPAPGHQEHSPDKHCACCEDTLLRQAAPAAIAAPRIILQELPHAAWSPCSLPMQAGWAEAPHSAFPNAQGPPDPGRRVPLFQRHCALLL